MRTHPFLPFAAIVASGIALLAAAPGSGLPVQLGGPYFRLETTDAHYNVGTGDFKSDVHVHLVRGGLDLVADRAVGNTKNGTAVMQGHVVVHDSGGSASPQGKNAEPATLTCDELDIDAKADTYKALGHAHYETATRKADSDTMNLERKARKLHLEGNVTVFDGASTMHANAVDADLKSGRTTTTGSPVQLSQPVGSPPVPAPTASPKR